MSFQGVLLRLLTYKEFFLCDSDSCRLNILLLIHKKNSDRTRIQILNPVFEPVQCYLCFVIFFILTLREEDNLINDKDTFGNILYSSVNDPVCGLRSILEIQIRIFQKSQSGFLKITILILQKPQSGYFKTHTPDISKSTIRIFQKSQSRYFKNLNPDPDISKTTIRIRTGLNR